MSYLNDIEDFSTDQLRAEIHRREQAVREGRCWYCQKNLEAHTCKHAKPSPVPGWEIDPPQWMSHDSNCMGHLEEYWQVNGRHPIMNDHVVGQGDTKEEATKWCIEHARNRQKTWQSVPAGKG